MRGDDSRVAVAVGRSGVRQIEGLKYLIERTAQDGDVSSADGAVVIDAAAFGGIGDILPVFVSENAATHLEAEPAGDAHDAIANLFAFKAAAIGAPEKSIFGVDFAGFCVELGAELIDIREHDLSVHGFDGPALLDEFDGQPIEQRLVGGLFAEASEVIDAGDNALAEVPAPDAIGHHARGERVAGLGHPLGELEATAFLGADRWLLVAGDDAEKATGNLRTERPMAASIVDGGVGNLSVSDAQGLGKFGRRLFETLGFAFHGDHLFTHG